VKAGYNEIAPRYLAERPRKSEDVDLLKELVRGLSKGSKVLDAGCGPGVPVTRYLARFFRVTGVDISEQQIKLARNLVPTAKFICDDIETLTFPDESFDGICSYYAIFHVPRSSHKKILKNFYRMLKPGGLALLCMGAGELPNSVEEYHGTKMYWSHYGSEKNLRLLNECKYDIIWSKRLKDANPSPLHPESAHLFVLAKKL
jgi:ubiquinone/menaquinone biosynthesis C-methylase UbiE